MTTRQIVVFVLLSFVLTGSAEYELRTWVDVDGNEFRGRFKKELFGKLTIESEEGDQKVFKLQELSDLDQKYLRVMVPPALSVKVVHRDKDVPNRPATMMRVVLTSDNWLELEIEKKSQRPFTSRLTAEIFLISQEVVSDEYVLTDKTEKSFILPTITKGASVKLRTDVVRIDKYQQNSATGGYEGQEYAGYLVLISLHGDLIHVETNLPSWIESPEVIENLRELYREGAAHWISRIFDKTGKKVSPPRLPDR